AGLSMGGFGALRIGARYGQRFSGISAHSSITSLDQMQLFAEEALHHYRQESRAGEDVFATIRQYREHLPPLRFDCGTSDRLIGHNRTLHRQLAGQGIAHEYEEFPGGHEWSYWEEHVRRSLLFFAKQL
ncbi:MAG TPA: alpha/beta hydrolase-fold protein, partial [Anseongella sp.]|nr:alpha/beta hydrolase-fold protein [Anseongella sp.]